MYVQDDSNLFSNYSHSEADAIALLHQCDLRALNFKELLCLPEPLSVRVHLMRLSPLVHLHTMLCVNELLIMLINICSWPTRGYSATWGHGSLRLKEF